MCALNSEQSENNVLDMRYSLFLGFDPDVLHVTEGIHEIISFSLSLSHSSSLSLYLTL